MSGAASTLKDVAEAAGVSLATASYALSDGGSIGQQTRARVKQVAADLGYRPNLSAKAMRTGRTGAIGLVLPDLTNPFFPQLAQTVIVAARDAGLDVFLTDTLGSRETERQAIQALKRRGIDGLIWFPIDDLSPGEALHPGVPTVILDRTVDGFDCVVADCEAGGRLAAQALMEMGHRRVGIVSGPFAALSNRQRVAGAQQALGSRVGAPVWIIEAAFSADLDEEVAQRLARQDVSAIIVGADLIALGVVRELRRQARRVPEDVSVIGFDNIPMSELCTPSLSTIDIPVNEMCHEAVQTLLRRINAPADPRRCITFGVSLVSRASVALVADQDGMNQLER